MEESETDHFQLKQQENSTWYQSKVYNKFWSMYYDLMNHAHQDFMQIIPTRQRHWGSVLKTMVKPRPPKPRLSRQERRRLKNNRKNKKKRKLRRRRLKEELKNAARNKFILSDDDILQVQLKQQMNLDDSSEVEEDYLQFLEKSVIHRIKRDAQKQTKTNKPDEECTRDIEKEEHPDIAREREMRLYYGDSSSKIYGMETAMQLSYDRISTRHQPVLWPNIPLKLAF